MRYIVYATPTSQRALRKLPEAVKAHLLGEIKALATHPLQNPSLQGGSRFLRSLHTRFRATDYRIAYEVDQKKREVAIHYVSTRENFYRKLRKLKLKSFSR